MAFARKVLRTEAASILALADRLDESFGAAVKLLRDCRGRVIVTGMGKSGIICRKIAATLASTGVPAFFLHPADATHGDLGVIRSEDVVVALSQSGETAEVLRLIDTIRRLRARLITLTGRVKSTLANAADVAIDCHVSGEACPLNLLPTASTTAALAMGDALAMTLLVARGVSQSELAHLHPAGTLGKRLMRVEQLMHRDASIPIVSVHAKIHDVVYEMSNKRLGMTCVVDDRGKLAGVITDGDLRKHMASTRNMLECVAGEIMTRGAVTIGPGALVVEAARLFEQRKITSLVIVRGRVTIVGILHLHDLWSADPV